LEKGGDESHIREQSIHYTAWYIAVPSIFAILFTVIIGYGKPKIYRRLSSMITRSKKCNNPIQRDSSHPNSENPNIPLAEATSLAKSTTNVQLETKDKAFVTYGSQSLA
jgi:hypothetical protein